MNIVQNNPFRLLGLLVGASATQFSRHKVRIPKYINSGNDLPSEFTDYSFENLGRINRTEDNIDKAASNLNLDRDKINAALFWFYNGNKVTDEPAFEALIAGELEKAVSIWSKLTSVGEVSKRNASAFSNLATLYLSGILAEANTKAVIWELGISLKLKFLESEFIKDFKVLATDDTFKITNKELQLLFLNQVQSEIEKSETLPSNKFLDILTKHEFSAKEDFLKGFVQKPIELIEKKVEEARSKRKSNKANSVNIGKALFEQTSENLKLLKSILGASNLKLSSISDKVSDEILQCGIDYFLYYKESNTDPGRASMDLFRKAKTLAIGNIAKQRCQENTETLQEWIDDKPKREKQARILIDFEKLKNLIDEYESRSETIANAKQILGSAMPHLTNVKNILGSTDDLYLGLSTRIASDSQNMLVSEINKLQERLTNTYENATKIAAIVLLKQKVNEAWSVTITIGSMDLRQDFRTRYTQNKTALLNLKTSLNQIPTGGGSGGSGGSSSGGCYIATMAYGDYDHPQVIILRQFRDQVLDKTFFGKWFIKLYYQFSPKLVEKLKNKQRINTIIRKTLNQFIKLIK